MMRNVRNSSCLIGIGALIVGFALHDLYAIESPRWVFTGNLNIPRVSHTATLLPNGEVLVAAGWSKLWCDNSAELYDATTETWRITGSLNIARSGHTATLLPNGLVLVVGGYNCRGPDGNIGLVPLGHTRSAELYDP